MNLDSVKIDTIKSYFQTQAVMQAYLFGSYVRGEANDDSDVDILVELDYNEQIGLHFIQMKLDLELLLKTKVDLVSSKGVSKYLLPDINKEKLLLYAK